jgi:hypothetical protein
MTDIKTEVQTSKFSYRIEPKPEGGFVATPGEPGMPAIEGATREEVQQKIEASITEMIGKELPSVFKLANLALRLNTKVNFTTRTTSGTPAAGNVFSNSSGQLTLPPSAAPIVPDRSSSAFLWVLGGLLVLAALIYFSYLHR